MAENSFKIKKNLIFSKIKKSRYGDVAQLLHWCLECINPGFDSEHKIKPETVDRAYNPSTQETEARGGEVHDYP